MKLDGIGKFIGSKIDEIIAIETEYKKKLNNKDEDNLENVNTIFTYPKTGFINKLKFLILFKLLLVLEWLTEIGLNSYLKDFENAGYDNLLACEDLTEEDLNNMPSISKPGKKNNFFNHVLLLKIGHKKILMNASKELKERRKICKNHYNLFIIIYFKIFYIKILIKKIMKKKMDL